MIDKVARPAVGTQKQAGRESFMEEPEGTVQVTSSPTEEDAMDMREASAMTEASGLTDEHRQTSSQQPDARPERASRRPPSPELLMKMADQLRETTVKAPLRSLLVAFLLGAWFVRRR
ncbi:hypothetical protein [Bradyrhizobium sp. DOA1]|uniref:hypothetical protein n=1 Tax=Bradyrhizobium sp. DOA1 TaxID=1126616 RepID=UPI001FD9815D|nr:hypothetical protein [Bradyrhizobium sp. DOA1]